MILRDARQPISQSLETRNLKSLTMLRDETSREISREKYLAIVDQYFKHRPQLVQFFCKRVHPNPTILYYNITIIKYNQLYYPKILIHNHCHSVLHQLDFRPRRHHSQEAEDNIQEMAHLAAIPSNVHG